MDSLILTSRYGRTTCTAAKVIAGSLAVLMITGVTIVVNVGLALALYGFDGLDCSIRFAPMEFVDGAIPFNLTCGTMLAYQVLLAFTGAFSVFGITLAVSALCKNPLSAFAVSAALYFFPVLLPVSEASALFRYAALLPVYHAQFVPLMSVEQINDGVLYALWAVPVALILAGAGAAISRRIFAGHQIGAKREPGVWKFSVRKKRA